MSKSNSEQLPSVNRVVLAYRIVQICLLLSLVWKWDFFVTSIKVYVATPILDEFFPEIFRSTTTLCLAFCIVIATTVLNILTGSRLVQLVGSIVSLVGLTVLCLHQGSYNDATFTTAWWTSLWSMWYVTRMNRDEADPLLSKAAFLGRCIVSMILLGGAAGKWTPEYWSGEVLHDIYFVDRKFWIFDWLRDRYGEAELRAISQWYSRAVVITETIAGLTLWMLPDRWAAVAAIALLSSIALFSNFLLFSVLLSLIGLASVGLFTEPRS